MSMISDLGQFFFLIGDGSFYEKCPIGTGSFWDNFYDDVKKYYKKELI